jgi:hypothetical protein
MITIEDWSTTSANADPYCAPERAGICIQGSLGENWIRTSRVVKVEGRVVTTKSGSTYHLGKVSDDFLAYLKKEGREAPDPENPIKVVS